MNQKADEPMTGFTFQLSRRMHRKLILKVAKMKDADDSTASVARLIRDALEAKFGKG